MPIRADLRHLYRGPAWRETRARILERAGNACEQCRKPNRSKVWTYSPSPGVMWWSRLLVPKTKQFWRRCEAQPGDHLAVLPARLDPEGLKCVRVVLTIAHLNHRAGDDRDDNLKALCQWCHLHYDKLHHRETRSARKDAARPLLHAAQSEANA